MAKKKLHVVDERMIELIRILKDKGIIKYRQEFLDVIGLEKENYRLIPLGAMSFTMAQVHRAGKEYRVNFNWLMGFGITVFRHFTELPIREKVNKIVNKPMKKVNSSKNGKNKKPHPVRISKKLRRMK